MKRLKLRSVLTVLLVIASITVLSPVGASAEWEKGVKPINQEGIHGNRPAYWYKEGESWATGWRKIEGDWYYFEPSTGYTLNGWKYVNGNWYCFDGFKGKMYHDTITLNEWKGQGYCYVNSDGVYIDNPPTEIKAYINMLSNNELKNLNIISSEKRLIGWMGMGSTLDKPVYDTDQATDIISDINHDGILEMSTSSRFGIKSIFTYSNGDIKVISPNTSTNTNATTTKNFMYQSNLQFNASNGKIVAYTGTDTSFSIPSSINGVNVTSIGLQSFGGNNTLTNVTIPTGITSIEKRAFGMCPNLKNITIPSSVTSIGEDAFLGSDNLTFTVENEQTKNLLIKSGVDASKIILKS